MYGSGDGAVTDPYNGTGRQVVQFNALRENQRASLSLVGKTLYVPWASHGDNGPYHGWVTAWDVSALTTTGFGDITLNGTDGRLLSVVIMLSGITLFLRLAQVLFRPVKVRHPCPSCGLQRHEPDAVHCKACGTLLCIPFDGHG